jgi:hypothetical protein
MRDGLLDFMSNRNTPGEMNCERPLVQFWGNAVFKKNGIVKLVKTSVRGRRAALRGVLALVSPGHSLPCSAAIAFLDSVPASAKASKPVKALHSL